MYQMKGSCWRWREESDKGETPRDGVMNQIKKKLLGMAR